MVPAVARDPRSTFVMRYVWPGMLVISSGITSYTPSTVHIPVGEVLVLLHDRMGPYRTVLRTDGTVVWTATSFLQWEEAGWWDDR